AVPGEETLSSEEAASTAAGLSRARASDREDEGLPAGLVAAGAAAAAALALLLLLRRRLRPRHLGDRPA
ncbi:MAG: hypothetical protein ACRDLD_07555, partial [Thermoleophilaceae bacterium]